MELICRITSASFEITAEDLAFYDRVSPVIAGKKFPVPPPTVCPESRIKQKLCFVNERQLYERRDSLHGKPIVSLYRPDTPFPVYHQTDWWSDAWDALAYGRDFDFSRTFFEQFAELSDVVPRQNLFIVNSENCDYCSSVNNSRNCYLTVGYQATNCLYGHYTRDSCDSMDYYFLISSNYCYECVYCRGCYQLFYSQYCDTCSESHFLYDCRNCDHCFACVGLRHKRFHIFNKQVSEKEYWQHIKTAELRRYSRVREWAAKFEEYRGGFPKLYARIPGSIDSSGDDGRNLRNSHYCFEVDPLASTIQDCKHVWLATACKDCYDVIATGEDSQLCYHSWGAVGFKVLFCFGGFGPAHDLLYCNWAYCCSDSLGCIGLRHKQYCILNKQYTKDEYEQLASRIISHMQETGEWGEFFPPAHSPFGYNESIANDFFPMQRNSAISQGFNWSDYERPPPKVSATIAVSKIPDSISDLDDAILQQAVCCEETGRPFKIMRTELEFYRKYGLPLPRLHPDLRHRNRCRFKNPRKLWARFCAKCGSSLLSSYAPEKSDVVYCEKCYTEFLQNMS